MIRSAFAPAKVNLFLHVGPPQADGYHPLCSLMVFADVGDVVHVGPPPSDQGQGVFLGLGGPFGRELQDQPGNLVMKAAAALPQRERRTSLMLALVKSLPIAAGLGGGSSDAGAALRLLREAWALELSDEELEAVAAGLGADGAACLWGRPVIAQGRGERLSPAPALPELHAVLVNPGVAVSTPAVYRALDGAGAFGDVQPPPMPAAFESAEEVAGWLAGLRNDLEAPAIVVEPRVGDVLETLAGEPEALLARVSGSGGTCFALCAGDVEAEGLAERIEAMRPGWWVKRCRLGGPWPDPA